MRAKMLSSKGSANKSKKALKRKVFQKDGAEYGSGDEAVLNVTGTTEAQAVRSLGLKKRKKKHQDVTEEREENVQQEHSTKKKRVKFNLESSTSDLEQKSMEGQSKGKLVVSENGAAEEVESNGVVTSWVQRASWKSLVGETGRVAFSLGSVLGDANLSAASMEQPPTEVHSSSDVSAWIDGTSASPLLKPPAQSNGRFDAALSKKPSSTFKHFKPRSSFGPSILQSVETDDGRGGLRETTDHGNAEKPTNCLKEVFHNHHQNGVEKSCTFMRSENYEQEWFEAKRAVKEIFKRTRKDALRGIKMFHTRNTT